MGLDQKVLREAHAHALARFQQVAGNVLSVPELFAPFFDQYRVSTIEDVLEPLLEGTQVVVGSGGFNGDEAKGKLGNALLSYIDLAVRAHSGANTGRTAFHPITEEKFVFHIVPSAILHGVPCLVGAETTPDPISLMYSELLPLQERGIDISSLTFGNFYCTTPAHRIMDVLGSSHNGSTGVGIKGVHESIKRKTALRLNDLLANSRHIAKRLTKDMLPYSGFVQSRDHLGSPKKVLQLLEQKREEEEKERGEARVVPDHVLAFARRHTEQGLDYAIAELAEQYQELVSQKDSPLRKRGCTRQIIRTVLEDKGRILLEGTQGFLLANNFEVYHRTATSADTNAAGILASAGIDVTKYRPLVISVQKAPGTSKVGTGSAPFSFCPADLLSKAGAKSLDDLGSSICADFEGLHQLYFENITEGGLPRPFVYESGGVEFGSGAAMAISTARRLREKGATTGKPRITGWFDCLAAYEVVESQGPHMFLSALDRGDLYQDIGLIVGYVVSLPDEISQEHEGMMLEDSEGVFLDCNGSQYRNGHIIQIGDTMPNAHVLEHCLPIVRTMPGWGDEEYLSSRNPEEWEGSILPQNASNLIATIEGLTGANIIGVGIGPKDHQALYLEKVNSLCRKNK